MEVINFIGSASLIVGVFTAAYLIYLLCFFIANIDTLCRKGGKPFNKMGEHIK